jgi:hypothetical protein
MHTYIHTHTYTHTSTLDDPAGASGVWRTSPGNSGCKPGMRDSAFILTMSAEITGPLLGDAPCNGVYMWERDREIKIFRYIIYICIYIYTEREGERDRQTEIHTHTRIHTVLDSSSMPRPFPPCLNTLPNTLACWRLDCMYVCVCVCVYVCMHACMYVSVHISTTKDLSLLAIWLSVCIYVCIYVCMCAGVCMHACVYTHYTKQPNTLACQK